MLTNTCVQDTERALRQRILEDFGVLDDVRDEGLDTAVRMASLASECESAFISFVDWKGGKIRFKHNVGMAFSEAPIVPGESFCDLSVMGTDNVNIPDTSKHPMYEKSRFVLGEPRIVFYFAVGLILDQEAGVPVGVLCAIDSKPRYMREEQIAMMNLIAKDVVRQLQLKRTLTKCQQRVTEMYEQKQNLETTLNNKDLTAEHNVDTVLIQQTLNAQFMASLSHELRTPTNIVQCSLVLLQSTAINEEQAEYIQTIQDGVNQLQNVLDKSVEHLDTTSHALTSNPILFNIHKTVEKLLFEHHSSSSFGKRELLTPVIEVNVPQVLVGDSAKLSQILGYFLENSVKFTDSSSGKVGVYVTLQEQESVNGKGKHGRNGENGGENGIVKSGDSYGSGDRSVVVDFHIFDNGVGMNSDTRALLFKPLQSDRHGGMGFGLVTSHNLATLIRGSIQVASRQKGDNGNNIYMGSKLFPYDQGSIFTLSVPLFYPSDSESMSIDLEITTTTTTTTTATATATLTSSPPTSLSQIRSSPLISPVKEPRESLCPSEIPPISLITPPTSPRLSSSSDLLRSSKRPHIVIPPTPEQRTSPRLNSSVPLSPNDSPFTPLSPSLSSSSSSIPSPSNTTPTSLDMTLNLSAKFKSSRILVVEDNVMNTKVLKRMLEKMGFVAACARDGAQAISMYTEDPDYGLILMDLHMPVMDGLTATRLILDIAAGLDKPTKIVAVTSSVSVEVRKDCLESGMAGFIAKPISLNALVKVLNTIV